MDKTCIYCDTKYTDRNCPNCPGVEPKQIDGYLRTKHPLYQRWLRLRNDYTHECDETFFTFYTFVKWFKTQSTDYTHMLCRRNQNLGWTVDNCFVSANTKKRRHSFFEKMTMEERQKFYKILDNGFGITQIQDFYNIQHPTAKRLIKEAKAARESTS